MSPGQHRPLIFSINYCYNDLPQLTALLRINVRLTTKKKFIFQSGRFVIDLCIVLSVNFTFGAT